MRFTLVLLASTALSACGGGGGPISAGGAAVSQGGVGTIPDSGHTFVKPTEAKTYQGIGGAHSNRYATDDRATRGQYSGLYQGDATTARNSGITIKYDPRDAIYELKIEQPLAGTNNTIRFQDPLHRTAFGGVRQPQSGTPDFSSLGVEYLQAGDVSPEAVFDLNQSYSIPIGPVGASFAVSTFFSQKPGTTTKYVTFAGYVRNIINVTSERDTANSPFYLRQTYTLERAAFAYGERTAQGAVPRTGSGAYTGPMVATMIFNPLSDLSDDAPTYFQWISGTATTKVDFGLSTFGIELAGKTDAPGFDVFTNRQHVLAAGSTFAASGAGRVDLINAGGFLGAINSASFTTPTGTKFVVNTGGSSVDGAFFGPAAQEVGGGFRIVGGTPDQAIDILGTFTGVK
jgi:hypothetical protein